MEEIWCPDAIDQGDSGVLNRTRPGQTCTFSSRHLVTGADGSQSAGMTTLRDYIQFLTYYLPLTSAPATLPYLLPAHSSASTYPQRSIIGVGHSLGSTAISNAAIALPRLFAGLMIVDTTMIPTSQPTAGTNTGIANLALGALVRKDLWAGGREEALEGFRQKQGILWEMGKGGVGALCGVWTDRGGEW